MIGCFRHEAIVTEERIRFCKRIGYTELGSCTAVLTALKPFPNLPQTPRPLGDCNQEDLTPRTLTITLNGVTAWS